MELNGMCLIWGWQSTNCFLFELLPAWLGTAVIETIMFHSSLAIIYLKSSFTAILFSFLKSLPLPLPWCQGLHPFCAPRFLPGLSSAFQAHKQPECPWTSPICLPCPGHRARCSTGHRAPFPQSQVSALPLAQNSGEHILMRFFTFPFKAKSLQWLWDHLILCDSGLLTSGLRPTSNYKWRGYFLPPVPCFVALCGSYTLHRGSCGCGSAGYMLGVRNRLPFLTLPIYKQFLLCFHPILINRRKQNVFYSLVKSDIFKDGIKLSSSSLCR